MKKALTVIVCLTSLFFMMACGGGDGTSGTSQVTITLDGDNTASIRTREPTFIATFLNWLDKIQITKAMADIPPAVETVKVTVSGEGIETPLEKSEQVAGRSSVTISLEVPNGPQRLFVVDALNQAGSRIFTGQKTVNLTGQPISVPINMENSLSVDSSGPEDNAVGVARDAVITATFSTAIDVSIISSDTFQVWERSQDGALVPVNGTVAYDQETQTATFTPEQLLERFTEYTATVSSDVIDSSGENSLASNFVWDFSSAWTLQFGTTDTDVVFEVAVDTTGDAYVAGRSLGDIDDDPDTLGAFLVKYDISGNQQWVRQFGAVVFDDANGVAVDAVGNAYVAGDSSGDIDDDSDTLGGAFLAKYDTSGNQQWIRQFGPVVSDSANGVAVDAVGNAYVAGHSSGPIGADPDSLGGAFLAKYNASGDQLWINQFGPIVFDTANGVAVDAAGNAYVAGYFSGEDGTSDSRDILLAKYDTSGNQLWIQQFGTAVFDVAYEVAVDAAGNAYVAGESSGDIDGDPDTLGGVLAKYDTSGNQLWVRQFGPAGTEIAYGVALDAAGNAYVVGHGHSSGDIDNDPATLGRAFLVKYDASGNQQWIRQFGTVVFDSAFGVALDAVGKTYIGGDTRGSLDGNPNTGGLDAILVKYDAEGNKQ